MSAGPTLHAIDLAAALDDARLVVLDARSGPDRRERFAREHISGARFVDLELDLARLGNPSCGGRHPLPPAGAFGEALGRAGVRPLSRVVVYDDRDGANAAARAWWMLRAIGHHDVALLDGGLSAARRAGVPMESGLDAGPSAPPYSATSFGGGIAEIDEVDTRRIDPDFRIVDARDVRRFVGDIEPFDPVAGHVPGAVSAPYTDGLDSDGLVRPADALRAHYEQVLGGVPPERAIVHCGSGVTACHVLLQLELAGMHGARLWVGSWSEWCRQDRPVGRGA